MDGKVIEQNIEKVQSMITYEIKSDDKDDKEETQTVEENLITDISGENRNPALGIRLGKYTLIRPLGQGGEGSVYLAKDEHLQRFVAMKCIRRTETDRLALDEKEAGEGTRSHSPEQIMQEADYLLRLEHPMLPVIYDLFEDIEGVWYLVMEYIQGTNLHEYIERNGFVQEEQARIWAEQLLNVLGYLHKRKPPVIYSDLKPDNIMVCPDGKLRLVDFGAALTRSFGADRNVAMAVTPGYGAPEQWGAIREKETEKGYATSGFYADERSDIYALGKVLYYMVTGADPSKPPYTALPVYEYQPLLGDDLEMMIRKCIRQEPEQRYQTVDDVQKYLGGNVGRRKRMRRKSFIRMVEKRIWLTEGETTVQPGLCIYCADSADG